jgi:hypothetical protein
MANDLDEGSVFTEFQVSSWPPPVTQTVLRKSDRRQGITIRAKPSGRLRVELVRQGYQPVVIRSKHLDVRTPTLLRLNVVWHGKEAAVAANGQVIGTSSDVFPEGVVTPADIQLTEAPTDHVDNHRARASRLRRAELMRARLGPEGAQIDGWFASLAAASQVVDDLAELVREGRHHHLAGLTAELARLIVGSQRNEPLLQWCAGMVDAPLLVFAPMVPPARTSEPVTRLMSAFDVKLGRDERHQLGVDLDMWLQHDVPLPGGQPIPVAGLLAIIVEVLRPARPDRSRGSGFEFIRDAFSQNGDAVRTLCAFAANVCRLANAVVAANREIPSAGPPPKEADSSASFTVQVGAPVHDVGSHQGPSAGPSQQA